MIDRLTAVLGLVIGTGVALTVLVLVFGVRGSPVALLVGLGVAVVVALYGLHRTP